MMKDDFFGRCWRVTWMAALGGSAAVIAGQAAACVPLETGGIVLLIVAGVAFAPIALVLAALVVLVIFVVPLALALEAWRIRRAVREIDALDAREADESEYDAPFKRLPPEPLPAARARVLDVTRPSRRRWLHHADPETLRALADSADPIAPFASDRLRDEAVAEDEIVRAWAREVR